MGNNLVAQGIIDQLFVTVDAQHIVTHLVQRGADRSSKTPEPNHRKLTILSVVAQQAKV